MPVFSSGRPRTVGFVTNDARTFGASPDRLLYDAGGTLRGSLEVKCPAPHTHLTYAIEGPGDAYRPQVQGQLYVCETDLVDFFSFHPAMPPVQLRTHRDEAYIRRLAAALDQFNDMRFAMIETARAAGFYEASASVLTPIDQLAQSIEAEFAGTF